MSNFPIYNFSPLALMPKNDNTKKNVLDSLRDTFLETPFTYKVRRVKKHNKYKNSIMGRCHYCLLTKLETY